MLVILLLLANVSFATPMHSQVYVPLQNKLHFFHDSSGNLSFAEIANKKFDAKLKGGFFPGAVWTKTNLCDYTTENLTLIYKDPIDTINVYSKTKPQGFAAREPHTLAPSFWHTFPLDDVACDSVYIKFQSGDVVNFSVHLMDAETLKTKEANHLAFYSLFYSFLTIILLVSLFLLFKLRGRVYLYFSLLLITQDFLGASLLNGFLLDS